MSDDTVPPPHDAALPPDPDTARLLEDVQAMGMQAASRVVEQFSRLLRIDGATPTVSDNGSRDTSHDSHHNGQHHEDAPAPTPDDLAEALRTARVQVERAIDGAMTALSGAVDGYARVIEAALGRAPSGAPQEIVVVEVVDGHGAASVWLHHDADTASEPLTVRVGPLVNSEGVVLDATTGVVPDVVGPLAPDASAEVRVTVSAPDAAAGRYHGLVLAAPGDLAVRITVVVEP